MSDKRKLYTIVGGGFGGNIRQALVSFLYPVKMPPESVVVQIPSVVSLAVTRPPVINEIEALNLPIPTVVSLTLESFIKRVNITEGLDLPMPSVQSVLMKRPIIYSETEAVNLPIPSVVSIEMKRPVFINAEAEAVNLPIPSVVSLTMTRV